LGFVFLWNRDFQEASLRHREEPEGRGDPGRRRDGSNVAKPSPVKRFAEINLSKSTFSSGRKRANLQDTQVRTGAGAETGS
jgi:hypothetical protein